MENPIKMDDLGVRVFQETPIWKNNVFFSHVFLAMFTLPHIGGLLEIS